MNKLKQVVHGEKEGFSLVEMVIAMAVTVIVMAGIISLIAYSTRSMSITQARAALQDAAKDSVAHISTHVMEGDSVTPYEDTVAGDGVSRGALLIRKKKIKGDGTEEFSWFLYWVSSGMAAGDSDMLCFAPLADLGTELSMPVPDDFDTRDDAQRLNYIAALVPAVESAGRQKRHLLCDDVFRLKCEVQQKVDPADSTSKIGRPKLHVALTLRDDKSEFECDKDIFMRNQ